MWCARSVHAGVVAHHPTLLTDAFCTRFLGFYVRYARLDPQTGGAICCATTLRQLYPKQGHAGALVRQLIERMAVHNIEVKVTGHSFRDKKARTVHLVFHSPMDHIVYKDREGDYLHEEEIDLVKGRSMVDRTRRMHVTKRAEAMRAKLTRLSPLMQQRIEYHLDARPLTQAIRQNFDRAVDAARGIRNHHARHACLRQLREIRFCPKFIPGPSVSGKSARIFMASSIQQLPATVRHTLLPHLADFDLCAAHLGVLATLVGATKARSRLQALAEARQSPWLGMMAFIMTGAPVANVGAFKAATKTLTYAAAYGMGWEALERKAHGMYRRCGAPQAAARFLQEPLLQDLLLRRDELFNKLRETGRADTPFGPIEVPHKTPEGAEEYDGRMRSALACKVQEVEAQLMWAAYAYTQTQEGARIVNDQYDGFSVQFRDLRMTGKIDRYVQGVQAAVAAKAAELGVPTWLQLTYDPRSQREGAQEADVLVQSHGLAKLPSRKCPCLACQSPRRQPAPHLRV